MPLTHAQFTRELPSLQSKTNDDAIEFLHRIYGGFDRHSDGVFVISHIYKQAKGESKKNPRTFRYLISEIPNIDWTPHTEANEEGWDIYFGSAIRTPELLDEPGHSRGGVADCILSTCLVSDIDLYNPIAHKAENLPGTIKDAAIVLDKLPEPSITLDSGYGLHVYHVYTDDVVLTSKKERNKYGRERKKTQSVYEKELKRNGWDYDATWTIDRIWRLPGFKNWKVRDEPREVTVLYGLDGDMAKYGQQNLIPLKQTSSKSPVPIVAMPISTVPTAPRPRASSLENLHATLAVCQSTYRDDALAWAASTDKDLQDQAEDCARKSYYLQQLLAGESIEEKGNRDIALTAVCGIISHLTPEISGEFSEADLKYVVDDLMRSSLQAWADDDEDTDLEREQGKAIDKLQRLKAKDYENRIIGLAGLRKALNQEATQGQPQQTEPLTDDGGGEEPLDMLSEQELLRVGLITYTHFTYVFDWTQQRYFNRPARNKADLRQMIRECWPEDDNNCPFKHTFISEEGTSVDLPTDYLLRQYGSIAEDSHYSFLTPRSRFDREYRSYIINPAPWRFADPRFDGDIDEWLKLLGGSENYDMLCDWLAGTTLLDKPCAALYLDGPPGCGKSVFAHGAAQLWADMAPLYENAAGTFNDALLKSPVILVDEGFSGVDIKDPTLMLRRLVAQSSHSVNLKYGPKLELRNHLRFIVAANNDSVLFTGKEERLSENDSRAMAERIAYVKVTDEARDFFLRENRGNRLTNKWLGREGLFARHVLWLRETRDLSQRGRFLVEGKQSDMHNQFLFQGNERKQVLEWLVRFSEAPMHLNSRSVSDLLPAEIGNGIVAVNTKKMKDNWKEFSLDRHSVVEHSHLMRHLKTLSHQSDTIQVSTANMKSETRSNLRYWAIPVELILTYARSHDIGDIERIAAHGKRETEITRKIVNAAGYVHDKSGAYVKPGEPDDEDEQA